MSKAKILLVSCTVPENKMGGGLILFRQFILKNDYEIGVVTNSSTPVPGVFYRQVPESRLLKRIKRTPLSLLADDYTQLIHARIFDRRLYEGAQEFKPDLIFNVAETYFSFHAQMLAEKLGIPFVSYFMDWVNFGTRTHKWVLPQMDRMFRELYRKADLALCISEGMKEELGAHPNAHVLYPSGADINPGEPISYSGCKPFTFCFAGNLDRWYGTMVQDIIQTCAGETSIALRVFGTNHRWSEAFVTEQRSKGVFLGFQPFESLIPEFQRADAFLLPMGFTPDATLIEKTSFKTKLLDYILFEKPMLVWGPEYSTAVKIARKFECAHCVTDPSPQAALAGMKELAKNRGLQEKLARNARKMRETEFNHRSTYAILKTELDKLLR